MLAEIGDEMTWREYVARISEVAVYLAMLLNGIRDKLETLQI